MGKSDMTKAMEDIAAKLVGVEVTELPAVSGSDNGKALMVSGGKGGEWTIQSQLPSLTAGPDDGTVLTDDDLVDVLERGRAAGDLMKE